MGSGHEKRSVGDFLFDLHFVDLENIQPLARYKVQKFAEVTNMFWASSV